MNLKSENAEINNSCIYFSVIGSLILKEHYRIDAKVYMGVAAFMVDEKNKSILTFAEKHEDNLICSGNGFHAWVVADEWVVDFTAPLYPRMIRSIDNSARCESKIFQKQLSEMCPSPADLQSNGNYFINEDIEIANKMMDIFISRPLNIDLANICCKWYRRPPSKMKKFITVGNGKGGIKQVPFNSLKVKGNW